MKGWRTPAPAPWPNTRRTAACAGSASKPPTAPASPPASKEISRAPVPVLMQMPASRPCPTERFVPMALLTDQTYPLEPDGLRLTGPAGGFPRHLLEASFFPDSISGLMKHGDGRRRYQTG